MGLIKNATTTLANALVRSLPSGKLSSTWGGEASTLATLDANVKVVENPASAQTTAGASKIPISGADNTLADGFLATGSATAGMVPTKQADGSKTWQSPTGSAGGDGAGMYASADFSWSNGTVKQLFIGTATKINAQVEVLTSGSTNVSDSSWDFDAADAANYTQGDSATGTKFYDGIVELYTPSDRYLTLLLHGEGSEGSKTFTDKGNWTTQPSWTSTGATGAINTLTQSKIGGISIKTPGITGEGLKLAASSHMLHSGAFTYSFWIRPTNLSGVPGGLGAIMACETLCQHDIYVTSSGEIRVYANGVTGSPYISTATGVLVDDTWQHVEYTRNASNLVKIYVDGVEKASTTKTGDLGSSSKYFTFGYRDPSASHYWVMYLDDLQVRSTSQLHTAAFTPTTTEQSDRAFVTSLQYVYTGKLRSLQSVASIVSLTLTGSEPTNTTLRCLYSTTEAGGSPVWKNASDTTVALSDALTNWSTLSAMQTKFTNYTPSGSDANWRLAFGFQSSDGTATPSMSQVTFVYNENSKYRIDNSTNWTVDCYPSATAAMVEVKDVSAGNVTARIVATASA